MYPKQALFILIVVLKINCNNAFTNLNQKTPISFKVLSIKRLASKYEQCHLALLPQQLGEFESLEIPSDSGIIDQRRVGLYDFVSKSDGKLVPYTKAWDFQKSVLESHLERLKNELVVTKRDFVGDDVLLNPNISSQWLPDLDSSDEILSSSYRCDSIIMIQHEPVYTLGTASDPAFIKTQNNERKKGVDIVRIERGGEVTYHGPGQLVVYPIMDLRGYKRDIHWYMRALEETVLVALNLAGIKNAEREDDVTGVWVEGKKVAAIGVKVRRWVTMHGIGVNVDDRSLANFDGIVPCGLVGRDVGCINHFLDEPITIEDFAGYMSEALESVFKIKLVEHPQANNF